jgi:hypothetical protein
MAQECFVAHARHCMTRFVGHFVGILKKGNHRWTQMNTDKTGSVSVLIGVHLWFRSSFFPSSFWHQRAGEWGKASAVLDAFAHCSCLTLLGNHAPDHRPGARDATMATTMLPPGSLERSGVRPRHRLTLLTINPMLAPITAPMDELQISITDHTKADAL